MHCDETTLQVLKEPDKAAKTKSYMWVSASVRDATSSANIYSLIETAKASGLEPYTYLRQIFTEMPKVTTVEQVEALLPWRVNLQDGVC